MFIGEKTEGIRIVPKIETPELSDPDARKVCEFVWRRYSRFNDVQLVNITHKDGTPWSLIYEEGKNKEIPDLYTKVYFRKLYNSLLNWAKNGRK